MTLRACGLRVALFLGFAFVVHAAGLLLHEFGGHALAATALGCGVRTWNLTYFGHGEVDYADCHRWTLTTFQVASWAGIAVTLAVGGAAWLLARRALPAARARPFLSLTALLLLLQSLTYVVLGGFHRLYDPQITAVLLARRGLAWMLWAPGLGLFAVCAFALAFSAVDALRRQLGGVGRARSAARIAGTVGLAGALYFCAYALERNLREDLAVRGVEHEAARQAQARARRAYDEEARRLGRPPTEEQRRRLEARERPFPMGHVLWLVAGTAVVSAMGRRPPRDTPDHAAPIGRAVGLVFATATAALALALTLLRALAPRAS